MTWKRGFIVLFLILLLSNLLIFGAVNVSGVDNSDLEQGVENVKSTAENIKSFGDKERWEFLSEQWREILLKNEAISAVDSFMNKVDNYYLFLILFNERYELSLTFFFALIWWIFLFFVLSGVFRDVLPFSKITSSFIALALAVIVGHLGLYGFLSLLTFKVIFYQEGIWGWSFTLLFFVLYFVFLVYLKKIITTITNILRNVREKNSLRGKVEKSDKFIEGYRKGYK